MLGTIFRGAFLIGILVWYSSNVWKMIDDYFKDQFRSYLEEEYRKNPRMRQDVQNHAAGNTAPSISTLAPETTVAPQRKIPEACVKADCPVEVAENQRPENGSTGNRTNDGDTEFVAGGGTSENEVESSESTDKNAFRESGLESRNDKLREESQERPSGSNINQEDRGIEKKSEVNDEDQSTITTTTITSPTSTTDTAKVVSLKKRMTKQAKKAVAEPLKAKKSAKKRKVKTIVLTEADFATAKGGRGSDDDFWEFEEDAEERDSPRGVLVSELPFKPRADIGDLERVTEDEYCPLTVEDEHSCEEAVPWP